MNHLFVYYAPTEITIPLYKRIKDTEAMTFQRIERALKESDVLESAPAYKVITQATCEFYELVEEVVPKCADKDAALRCIRLARMAANEAVTVPDAIRQVEDNLRAARWQACSAIALRL